MDIAKLIFFLFHVKNLVYSNHSKKAALKTTGGRHSANLTSLSVIQGVAVVLYRLANSMPYQPV